MPRQLAYLALPLILTVACGGPSTQDTPKKIENISKERESSSTSKDKAKDKKKKQSDLDAKSAKTNPTGSVLGQLSKDRLKIGQVVPNFQLPDLKGKKISLEEFRGKTVVLEWFNPDCPFVRYSHENGALKSMAADEMKTNPNLVWLAINSGGVEKQGHGVQANTRGKNQFGMNYPILSDETGEVGRKYFAKSTPHMFLIDPEGKLVYQGAIDNSPMGEVKGESRPTNYLKEALEDLANKRPISQNETIPYGCSIKYGNKAPA